MQKLSIEYDGGILLETKDSRILIDPYGKSSKIPDVVLVSHAHMDHSSGIWNVRLSLVPKVMSPATREILESTRRRRLRNVIELREGEYIDIKNIRIYAESAGHCAGSLQFLISFKKFDVVYSGDFCFEKRMIFEKCRPLKGDILILEATYGSPKFVFPPREQLYKDFLEWVRGILETHGKAIIKCRKLGTAQELTMLLSRTLDDNPLVVHDSIAKMNVIHEKYHQSLGPYIKRRKNEDQDINGIFLMPISAKIKYGSSKVIKALVSGRIMTLNCKYGFPISSHADFIRLIEYARESQACEVFTVYGYAEQLINYLRNELGVCGQHLKRMNKKAKLPS